jgi:hypothetical protein
MPETLPAPPGAVSKTNEMHQESLVPETASCISFDSRAARWPAPLSPWAFWGLAGEVVRTIDPHTESDPAAVLGTLLLALGNLIGRGPHAQADAARHSLNLNLIIVGESSHARKGSGCSQVKSFLRHVDPEWLQQSLRGGLSTGEGLISEGCDPLEKQQQVKDAKTGRLTMEFEKVVVNKGVADKRLLVIEPEFGRLLTAMEREGNTLSAVIRAALDGDRLQVMTRGSPIAATETHITIIGHITVEDLERNLTRTEMANGFVNRFLVCGARRSKLLPEGGGSPDYEPRAARLRAAVHAARGIDLVVRDAAAKRLWASLYPRLSAGLPGLFGAVTARAEAQVLRLSTLYAVLDGTAQVGVSHLLAGLAF